MATILEERRAIGLSADRHKDRMALNMHRAEEAQPKSSVQNVDNSVWVIIFGIGVIFYGIDVLLDVLGLVIISAAINFMAVLGIWIWAKGKRLKSPSLTSSAKKALTAAEGAVKSAAEELGQRTSSATEKIEEAIPGNDLLYIIAGGAITPIAYIFALWLNNR